MYNLCDQLKPLNRILNLKKEGWIVWDCSPIYGEDGQVHVFAARWPDKKHWDKQWTLNWLEAIKAWTVTEDDGPDKTWHLGGGQIVHAVAPTPEGPYKIADVVIACEGGSARWDSGGVINSKIYCVEDRYCLIYAGCQSGKKNMGVGMYTAASLHGPWKRVAEHAPLLGSPANNPALLSHPNGQFWIYYKGPEGISLATADQVEGPYRDNPSAPVVNARECVEQNGCAIEDPYVWYDGHSFWMLCSKLGIDGGAAGILFRSDDGIEWDRPVDGYPSPAVFNGKLQRLEEPNLLFRNGAPTHLFNVMGACPQDPVYSGFVFAIK